MLSNSAMSRFEDCSTDTSRTCRSSPTDSAPSTRYTVKPTAAAPTGIRHDGGRAGNSRRCAGGVCPPRRGRHAVTWSSPGAGMRAGGHWRRCAATSPRHSTGSPGGRPFPVYRCQRGLHWLRRALPPARFPRASAATQLCQWLQWLTTAMALTTIDSPRRRTPQRVRPLRTGPPHRRGRSPTPKALHLPRRSTRSPRLRRRRPPLRTRYRQVNHALGFRICP